MRPRLEKELEPECNPIINHGKTNTLGNYFGVQLETLRKIGHNQINQ